MTEEKEIWKDVLYRGGMYIGYYEVSNLGRVRSVKRQVKQGNHIVSVREKIKKQNIDAHGYPYVTLCKDKKSIPAKIHTLVAEAFIPNPENKPYVDHINTDRSDYRIENLRWVTPAENANNPITKARTEKMSRSPEIKSKVLETKKRRNNKTSPKIIHQFTLDGGYVATFESSRDAMRQTGINAISIREVIRGEKSSAGGFLWSETMTPPIYEPYKLKKKRVGQYDTDMNLIREWNSIGEAARALGLWDSNISRAIYGRTTKKCCGGFKWKFID